MTAPAGLLFLIVIVVAVLTAQWQTPPISGPAKVIDGDTIIIANTRIRIFGIDAPEMDQRCEDDRGESYRCGVVSAQALSDIIGDATVVCDPLDRDRYGRVVASCSVGGSDIGSAMVIHGYAVDYSFFSGGKYRAEQDDAMRSKRGLWAGRFEMPWDWRRSHGGPDTSR